MGFWTVLQIVITVIAVVAAVAARKTAKAPDRPGISINRYGQNLPIPVVLGRREIPPNVVYQSVKDLVDQDPVNEVYYSIAVWCVGEIQDVNEIYLDDKRVIDFGFERQLTSENNSVLYINPSKDQKIEIFYGDETGGIPAWFADEAPEELSGMVFKGLCTSYIKLVMDNEFKTYPQGLPEFKLDIYGKKILDLNTNNSDKTTNNFPSQLYWYLTDDKVGKGETPTGIDLLSFKEMAEFSSQPVTLPDGESRPLKTSNIIIRSEDEIFNVVSQIEADQDAYLLEGQNGLTLDIDREKDPVLEFDDGNITGQIKSKSLPSSQRYNQVIYRYPDEDSRFQVDEVSFPKTGSALHSTWLAEDDGIELTHEEDLETITNHYEAIQKAEMLARSSREGINIEFMTNAIGWKLEIRDIITVSNTLRGWDKKPFLVTEIEYEETGVKVTAVEYQPSVYPWSDKTPRDDYPDTVLPNPFTIGTVTDLTFTPTPDQVEFSGDLNWTSPPSYVTFYRVRVKNQTGDTLVNEKVFDTAYRLLNLFAGDYTVEVFAGNDVAISTVSTIGFSLNTPPIPQLQLKVQPLSVQVIPSITGIAVLGITFELLFGTSQEQADADRIGDGGTFTMTGLRSSTEYHIWVRSVSSQGYSPWVYTMVTTTSDATAIIELIGEDIASQILPDVISAVQVDLETIITEELVDYPTNEQVDDRITDAITFTTGGGEDPIAGLLAGINDILDTHGNTVQIHNETLQRQTDVDSINIAIGDNVANLASLSQALTDETSVRVTEIAALTATTSENTTSLVTLNELLVNETNARVTSVSQLNASINTTNVKLNGEISRIDEIQLDTDGNASAISNLYGQVNDVTTGLSATYSLSQLAKTTSEGNATSLNVLSNTVDDPITGLSATNTLAQLAKTTADGNATSVTNLTSQIAGVDNTASSALTLVSTIDASLDEYRAAAQLSVDVNGNVGLIQLDATPDVSQIKFQSSQVIFQAPDGVPTVFFDNISGEQTFNGRGNFTGGLSANYNDAYLEVGKQINSGLTINTFRAGRSGAYIETTGMGWTMYAYNGITFRSGDPDEQFRFESGQVYVGGDLTLAGTASMSGNAIIQGNLTVVGTISNFTGSHPVIGRNDIYPEVGDLLEDVDVEIRDTNDTIGTWQYPNHTSCKVIGVFNGQTNDRDELMVNGLGEGVINVIGENGDIIAGDLLVASSTPGKAMRQDDDLIRSCTVAKSRQDIIFDGPSTVQQISCIYLSG